MEKQSQISDLEVRVCFFHMLLEESQQKKFKSYIYPKSPWCIIIIHCMSIEEYIYIYIHACVYINKAIEN